MGRIIMPGCRVLAVRNYQNYTDFSSRVFYSAGGLYRYSFSPLDRFWLDIYNVFGRELGMFRSLADFGNNTAVPGLAEYGAFDKTADNGDRVELGLRGPTNTTECWHVWCVRWDNKGGDGVLKFSAFYWLREDAYRLFNDEIKDLDEKS